MWTFELFDILSFFYILFYDPVVTGGWGRIHRHGEELPLLLGPHDTSFYFTPENQVLLYHDVN